MSENNPAALMREAAAKVCDELAEAADQYLAGLQEDDAGHLTFQVRGSAFRRAATSIRSLPAEAGGWQPGDLRCDVCDNGLEAAWAHCPFCGAGVTLPSPHRKRAGNERRQNSAHPDASGHGAKSRTQRRAR